MGFEDYYKAFPTYTDVVSKDYQKRIQELKPHLIRVMKNTGKVLDLACGVGGFSFLLEDYGFEVIGLDISDIMIKKALSYAREKHSRVKFLIGDAKELPFDNNVFDYVLFLGNSTAHFLPNELNRVFKEVKRVLKKDGLFLVNFIDMRALIPRIRTGTVVGEKYWINRIIIDEDEKTALVEYKSEGDRFEVKFVIWGNTSINLLAKFYFRPVSEVKLDEFSYLKVYQKK